MFYISPLKKINITDSIIGQIKMLLFNKKLKPGDKLPSERDLALKFNVGRSSVREAIKELCALGLLEIRPSQGTYVKTLSKESILANIISYFDLFLLNKDQDDIIAEVDYARSVLEPEIAFLAARNCNEEDCQELEAILNEAAGCLHAPEEYGKVADRFHKKLAEVSRNQVFVYIINALTDIIVGFSKQRLLEPAQIGLSYRHHCQILKMIKSKSAEQARAEMKAHMVYTMQKKTTEKGGNKGVS